MNCSPCSSSDGTRTIDSLALPQSFYYDTFNRLIVDAPTTIFASQNAFNPQFNILQYRSTGTGTVFVDTSNTIVELTVGSGPGRSIKQSREYLLYLPGKSQVVQFSLTPHYKGTFDNTVAVRVGLYDDYRDKNTLGSSNAGNALGQEVNQKSMGHYFELSGNQWFVVERYNSPDNVTNVTRVPQSQWNIDTVNGNLTTSKSGFVLSNDPTSGLLLFLDRQWLGVGMVRMGLFYNAKPIYVHAFQNRSIGYPYTHLPKLPIRYEIEKTGSSATSATFGSICAAAFVGGQYVPYGNFYSLPMTSIASDIEIDSTQRPVLLLRLQQQYCRATVKLKSIEAVNTNTNNQTAGYELSRNPTIVGPAYTWTKHPDPKSMIEYVVFTTPISSGYTMNDGYVFRSGYFVAGTQIQDDSSVEDLITSPSICSDMYGNSDVLCVSFQSLKTSGAGASVTMRANLRWLEIY